jgi:hypothetical protein
MLIFFILPGVGSSTVAGFKSPFVILCASLENIFLLFFQILLVERCRNLKKGEDPGTFLYGKEASHEVKMTKKAYLRKKSFRRFQTSQRNDLFKHDQLKTYIICM